MEKALSYFPQQPRRCTLSPATNRGFGFLAPSTTPVIFCVVLFFLILVNLMHAKERGIWTQSERSSKQQRPRGLWCGVIQLDSLVSQTTWGSVPTSLLYVQCWEALDQGSCWPWGADSWLALPASQGPGAAHSRADSLPHHNGQACDHNSPLARVQAGSETGVAWDTTAALPAAGASGLRGQEHRVC